MLISSSVPSAQDDRNLFQVEKSRSTRLDRTPIDEGVVFSSRTITQLGGKGDARQLVILVPLEHTWMVFYTVEVRETRDERRETSGSSLYGVSGR